MLGDVSEVVMLVNEKERKTAASLMRVQGLDNKKDCVPGAPGEPPVRLATTFCKRKSPSE